MTRIVLYYELLLRNEVNYYLHCVRQAVDYITYTGGRTNTASALDMLRTQMFTSDNGDRRDTDNYVIMITDGNSNVNRQDTVKAAIQVRLQVWMDIYEDSPLFCNLARRKAYISSITEVLPFYPLIISNLIKVKCNLKICSRLPKLI